jgi:fatty acid desaturase
MRGELTRTLSEVRRTHPEAFEPRLRVYWADLLVSAAVGWASFAVSVGTSVAGVRALSSAIAIVALLRVLVFVHELAHHRTRLPYFELAWNLLGGIPLLLPSMVYVETHVLHHHAASYGSADDPEYLPLARYRLARLAGVLVGPALLPLALPMRWGVLAPASLLSARLRALVWERSSSLVLNPAYRRPPAPEAERRRWLAQEMLCCALVWGVGGAIALGVAPLALWSQWSLVIAGIMLTNQVRTLVSHRFVLDAPGDLDVQLADSINLVAPAPLQAWFAPLGLRFHALHHAAPAIPYHGLGAVHRELLRALPQGAIYRRSQERSLLRAVVALFRRATV